MGRLVVVAVVLHASTALAQSNADADKLFRDGKDLIALGKIPAACIAFEHSERIEHSIATLLSLADCREREGKFATAHRLFVAAEADTLHDATKKSLGDTARTRIKALEAKLSYLTISIAEELQVPGLVIVRDNKEIAASEWNQSVALDDGEHVILAKAPGYSPWFTRMIVGPRNKHTIEIPKLEALRPGERPAEQPPSITVVQQPSSFTTKRKIAVGVGIGSVVIAGVSIALGVNANDLRDRALARCPATSCTQIDADEAQALNDRARDRALYANIGYGVAGAAAITAAILWFTGGPELAVTPTSNGVAFGGSF